MSWEHDRIPFRRPQTSGADVHGAEGVAIISMLQIDGGRTLVVCRDENQVDDDDANPVVPVNQVAQYLRDLVIEKYRIDPAMLVWLEWSEPGEFAGATVGGWEKVTFAEDPRTGETTPHWEQMTPDHWRKIGLPPVFPPDLP